MCVEWEEIIQCVYVSKYAKLVTASENDFWVANIIRLYSSPKGQAQKFKHKSTTPTVSDNCYLSCDTESVDLFLVPDGSDKISGK